MPRTTITTAALAALLAWPALLLTGGCATGDAEHAGDPKDAEVTQPADSEATEAVEPERLARMKELGGR